MAVDGCDKIVPDIGGSGRGRQKMGVSISAHLLTYVLRDHCRQSSFTIANKIVIYLVGVIKTSL